MAASSSIPPTNVITSCPKCGYDRKPTDEAPSWQCPACKVAYSKVGSVLPERVAPENHEAGDTSKRPSSQWMVTIGLAVMLVLAAQWKYGARHRHRDPVRVASVQATGQPEITFYSASWCGYCNATREFFKDNNIHFTELDIEKTSAGAEGYAKLGGNGVPLIVIGDDTIHGFDEPGLRRVLKPWMRS
ncbi:MAG: glutaredoxin family protein [Betaproteobacteria bacterium]